MSNSYKYDDPDGKYTNKNSGILWNLLNIENRELLHDFESQRTALRAEVLKDKSPHINNLQDIQKIHKFLFGEIYAWAGQLREVEIHKEGKQFHPRSHFKQATEYINRLITEYKGIDKSEAFKIAKILADILDSLNAFHPFREGNGRTQRLTVSLLAKEKGYSLDLNPSDKPEVYEKYMTGTIDGNTSLLSELIHSCLEPTIKQ